MSKTSPKMKIYYGLFGFAFTNFVGNQTMIEPIDQLTPRGDCKVWTWSPSEECKFIVSFPTYIIFLSLYFIELDSIPLSWEKIFYQDLLSKIPDPTTT